MMKNCFFVLLLIIFFSCNSHKNSGKNDTVKFDAFPLTVPEQNSLMARWEKKPVLETRLIDDMENDTGWEVKGIGEINYTQDHAKDGKWSLRFRTSLRDEEHYRQNRSKWDSFIGSQGGSSSVEMQFDTPQNWSAFNRLSFWALVHPTSMPAYCLNLRIENEGFVTSATTSRGDQPFGIGAQYETLWYILSR